MPAGVSACLTRETPLLLMHDETHAYINSGKEMCMPADVSACLTRTSGPSAHAKTRHAQGPHARPWPKPLPSRRAGQRAGLSSESARPGRTVLARPHAHTRAHHGPRHRGTRRAHAPQAQRACSQRSRLCHLASTLLVIGTKGADPPTVTDTRRRCPCPPLVASGHFSGGPRQQRSSQGDSRRARLHARILLLSAPQPAPLSPRPPGTTACQHANGLAAVTLSRAPGCRARERQGPPLLRARPPLS